MVLPLMLPHTPLNSLIIITTYALRWLRLGVRGGGVRCKLVAGTPSTNRHFHLHQPFHLSRQPPHQPATPPQPQNSHIPGQVEVVVAATAVVVVGVVVGGDERRGVGDASRPATSYLTLLTSPHHSCHPTSPLTSLTCGLGSSSAIFLAVVVAITCI